MDSFQDIDANAKPSLSVIVYADKEIGAYLNQSIPAIFNQNYNDYEVIIVNADSSETVDDMITILTAQYPKLKSTFIPDSICNVSIRKLAAMLGVKSLPQMMLLYLLMLIAFRLQIIGWRQWRGSLVMKRELL